MSSNPGPKKGLKIQPKNVARRSKEERDALARTEAERQDARRRAAAEEAAAEEARRKLKYGIGQNGQRGRWDGARGGASRYSRGGRGGFMGQQPQRSPEHRPKAMTPPRGGQDAEPAATPPTRGSATDGRTRTQGTRRVGTGAATRTRAKKDAVRHDEPDDDVPVATTSKLKKNDEEGIYVSSDEDESDLGRRIDIDVEHIDISSDSEPDLMAPVRIKRSEHVERSVGINTESSAATATGSRRSGRDGLIDLTETGEGTSRGRKRGKRRTTSEIKIKKDPEQQATDEDEEMVMSDVIYESDEARARTYRSPTKLKKRAEPRKTQPAFQTEEEAREHKLHKREVRTLLRELGQREMAPEYAPSENSDDDFQPYAQDEDPRLNNIYLFQFPPILPDLVPVNSKVKVEKQDALDDSGTDEEVKEVNGDVVKEEEDEAGPDAHKMAEKDSHRPKLAPGRLGKLRVHRSGKMTLDWGGTLMTLSSGMDANFWQSAALVEMEPKAGFDGVFEGDVKSMGKIRGKIVVQPDWDNLLV